MNGIVGGEKVEDDLEVELGGNLVVVLEKIERNASPR